MTEKEHGHESEEELRSRLQIGPEGISQDYYTYIGLLKNIVGTLLEKPGYGSLESEVEVKHKELLPKGLAYCISYSKYMETHGDGLLPSFLTEKGKEGARRLDEISVVVNNMAGTDMTREDMEALWGLIMEAELIMYGAK